MIFLSDNLRLRQAKQSKATELERYKAIDESLFRVGSPAVFGLLSLRPADSARRALPDPYENQPQQTCCAGCQAVAQTIIDSGQGAYYVHRTALPVTPQQIEAELAQLGLYDLPEIQQSFVRVEDEHIREAALMLENSFVPPGRVRALTPLSPPVSRR